MVPTRGAFGPAQGVNCMMNIHDKVMAAMDNFRMPVTAATVQSEITPRLNYATVYQCLNDLVRQEKLKAGKNELGKPVFSVR